MKKRDLEPILHVSLRRFPVVALFGPRQLGKTPLAIAVARSFDGAIYLHLTRPGYATNFIWSRSQSGWLSSTRYSANLNCFPCCAASCFQDAQTAAS